MHLRQEAVALALVAGLLLAAGRGSRFGGAKQVAEVSGRPLVAHVLAALTGAGVAPVVAVTGAHAEVVAPVLQRWPVQVVHNPEHVAGMSTSLRLGLQALFADPLRAPAAVLVALADMPGLTAAVVSRLVAAHGAGGKLITAPAVAGRRGNPVIFDASLVPELLAVQGDEGGRSVLLAHPDQVQLVPFADPAIFRDVDTPADLTS